MAHHGIKGQKWGVRRFQNPDGSYTAEGKIHYGVRDDQSGDSDYVSFRKKIADARPDGFSSKENKMINRIRNGEVLDTDAVGQIATDHHMTMFALGKKYVASNDENEKKQLNEQMHKEQLLMDYAYDQLPALNRENKYQKEIANEADQEHIDPSYRKFATKAEKAKAEESYLSMMNGNNPSSEWFDRECQHLFDRIDNLSMNGYDGKPQSERTRALYDYDPDGGDRPWGRYIPKYKKSKEWIGIQKEREALKDKTGLTEAENAMSAVRSSDIGKAKYDKLWSAWFKASQRYSKAVNNSTIEK